MIEEIFPTIVYGDGRGQGFFYRERGYSAKGVAIGRESIREKFKRINIIVTLTKRPSWNI
jgi:hypothetical protein